MLVTDALRQRGDHFVEHEEGSDRTVLAWDHEVVIDGSTLPRPVNYSLVRILPPAGVTVRQDGRPYMIIDPRAGHGSGIGGFKHESEVGAAIHQGHPTYFVTFTRLPVPGQTIADVTAAEADFAREVRRRHPDAPKPVIIGNRISRGEATLNARTHVDLRRINSPIIVFASHGDNITPPQQALGWIADIYKDVEEIRARGQRILYTLHENVGHLGIFVSSSVAKKEHEEIVSTLKAIEALSPGLYEMMITEVVGDGVDKTFRVAFVERTIEDMMNECGGDDSDRPFAAVARFSAIGTEVYDLAVRPFVQAMTNRAVAEVMANTSPMRLQRWLQSGRNPLLTPVGQLAEQVRADRRPAAPDNPFRQLERFAAGLVTQGWDNLRDLQNAAIEWNFHLIWGLPTLQAQGAPVSELIADAPQEDLRTLTSVQDALDRIDTGGFADGVIRMLIFLARSRKEVRRSRLERSNRMLVTTEPFASMKPKARTGMIHRESLIVGFEPEEALAALPKLIATDAERKRALAICEDIAGPREEMSRDTMEMLNRLALALGQTTVPEPGAIAAPRVRRVA